MYIWIGCDISPRFTEFREKIIALSDELGLDKTVFNFPQHISLKIVFDTEEEIAKHCIKDIIERKALHGENHGFGKARGDNLAENRTARTAEISSRRA